MRLGVNDDGDAEWSLVRGPHPRTTVIDTDADREDQEEERRLAHARSAEHASVDWKRVVDLRRPPALAYVDANICGGAFEYGWSADRTEAITLRAGRNLRDLAATGGTFDLAVQSSEFEVALHLNERPERSWPFCSDVGGQASEETWRATKGSVTLELSRRAGRTAYRATIRIVSAEFVNGSGLRVTQVLPIALTVIAR